MANPKSEIRNPKSFRSVGCTIEDQDERDCRVTARDLNIDAYQIMAEIQVNLRRIVHRGLEKVAGKTWYLDACPPGLFERLVERQENEAAIDRFDVEYQELITFASLDELAEIIDFNHDLAKLLTAIAPASTSTVDRLREIEVLRLKLAAAIPFDDNDIDNLLEYHQEFRDALARRMNKSSEAAPTPVPAPAEEEAAATDLLPDRDFGTQITEVDELRVEDVAPEPENDTAVAEVDASASSDQMSGAEEVVAAERAIASKDDVEVLRILHREVMSIAEAVYQRDLDRTHPVWEMLRADGWYDLKKADMALSPLELFFAVSEEARKRQRSGADLDELKAYLQEAEFTKLLLSLREMFMRNKL